jgi:cysteinyl-tRNA synthetase
MAMKHLGESFDLHSGGIDLIFPHHENEIAQSEAASGKPFVRHWFHVSHLLVDQQKMSKSLGNLHTVADVVRQGYDPSELRFVLLSGHYRQPLNFTWHSLQSARMALRRIQRTATALGNGSSLPDPAPHPAFHPVMVALLDDLNTPAALGRLFECLHAIEASLPTIHRDDRPALLRGLSFILERLGLLLPRTHANRDTPPESIRKLAEKRWLARTEKNWPQADRLRFELEQAGWAMADGKESFTLTAIKQATETPSS